MTDIAYYRVGDGECVRIFEYKGMHCVDLHINRELVAHQRFTTDAAAVKQAFEIAAKYRRPVRRYALS